MISIFTFAQQLKALHPTHQQLLDSLLGEQLIYGVDIYGVNEINDGGQAFNLPVYKTLIPDAAAVSVCSSSVLGKSNKLGGAQFLKLNIENTDVYHFNVIKNSGASLATDPDIVIYRRGVVRTRAESVQQNQESTSINLQPDTYIVEVYDYNNRASTNDMTSTTCFDVSVTR